MPRPMALATVKGILASFGMNSTTALPPRLAASVTRVMVEGACGEDVGACRQPLLAPRFFAFLLPFLEDDLELPFTFFPLPPDCAKTLLCRSAALLSPGTPVGGGVVEVCVAVLLSWGCRELKARRPVRYCARAACTQGVTPLAPRRE